MSEYIIGRSELSATLRTKIDLYGGSELIRCKDCKHRPTVNEEYENGFDIEFPNFMKCPCQCEDGWYNWMPKDDWYCANAERK